MQIFELNSPPECNIKAKINDAITAAAMGLNLSQSMLYNTPLTKISSLTPTKKKTTKIIIACWKSWFKKRTVLHTM